jgi:hypothetical protein
MSRSRTLRLVFAFAFVAALGIGTVSTANAGGPKILDSRMAGIPRAGLVLDGVTGGGAPWVIDEGHARLFSDGRLEVDVEGLVLADSHVNPVASGHAIVTCDGAPVATTQNVPFSPAGDAEVTATIALPTPCLAPAIFFTTGNDRWLAVTGF